MTGTLTLAALSGPRAEAPVPPAQRPLVVSSDLRYLGTFTLPPRDPRGVQLSFGGLGLGVSTDGRYLYFGCALGTASARVAIPEIGAEAVVEPCQTVPNLDAINPGDPNQKLIGGVLEWNGRVVVSAYAYYDGAGRADRSHFAGTSVATVQGPYRVGSDPPGMVGGYMGVIPDDWRTSLGGPALTGQCCISIISRSSYGPSVSVFDPGHVGTRSTIASTMLVGYPDAHQTLGPWDAANPLFSGTTKMGGIAFPADSRSLLFVGRHGTTYCYGSGTSDRSLHLRPRGDGSVWCFDPTDDSKGNHGYPYKHMVWAYDATELVAVKEGRKAPWDVRPYATWTLTEMSHGQGAAQIRGAVYAPSTRRLYLTIDDSPTVHVYEVGAATGTGPIELCGDQIDNDGDGQIDEDCAAPPPGNTPPGGGMPGDDDGDGDSTDDDDSDDDADGAGDDRSGDDAHKGSSVRPAWSAHRELAAHGVTAASLIACGSTVHVAYGAGAVYYRRSLDDGTTWLDRQQLGDGMVSAQSLACDGTTVVLTATRGGTPDGGDVWVWRSLDDGASWRAPLKVSYGGHAVQAVSAVAGGVVTTAWVEERADSPARTIHVRRSSEDGERWNAATTLASQRRDGPGAPSLVLGQGGAVVAWGAGASIEARHLEGGAWSPAVLVAPAHGALSVASLSATADGLVATIAGTAHSRRALTLARSTDGGATWQALAVLDAAAESAGPPRLTVRDGRLAVVWAERRDGVLWMPVRVSEDGGATWSAVAPLAGRGASAPQAAWSRAALHLLEVDASGGLHYARRLQP